MIKLLPLGVGNGFTKKYFHSNILLSSNNQYLLIDAGTTLRYSLEKTQVEISRITAIFITHFHHDHAGGLSEFLMRCYWRFDNGIHTPHKPDLLLRPSQMEDMNGLLSPALNNQGLTWKDYCRVKVIKNNHIKWNDIELEVLPTDNLHCLNFNSCGLKATDKSGLNLIISGDIKDLISSNLLSHVNQDTHAIVQDISFNDNAVHSSYNEVLDYYSSSYHPIIYGIHHEDDYITSEKYKINFLEEGKVLSFPCKP